MNKRLDELVIQEALSLYKHNVLEMALALKTALIKKKK